MDASNISLMTIDELTAQIAVELSSGDATQANGQIRSVPDARTIRYYTTLGLVDRPLEMRGRTALYGQRHLLQLVSIKRLQAKGYSLQDVQRLMLGLTDKELALIAKASPTPSELPKPRDATFWKARPAPIEVSLEPPSECKLDRPDGAFEEILLAEGITLVLSPARPLEADDVEAIRAAASPLVKVLEKRRLC